MSTYSPLTNEGRQEVFRLMLDTWLETGSIEKGIVAVREAGYRDFSDLLQTEFDLDSGEQ